MLVKISLQSSRRDDEDVYRAYRQIKYKVFVIEQGWRDRRSCASKTMVGGPTTKDTIMGREHETKLGYPSS